MTLGTRVRLCLKDLYSQDVVEMIERETRKYEVEAIQDPEHPDFRAAFQILWDGFGAHGEMESEEVIRQFLNMNDTAPLESGTFARYFLLVARDRATGAIRGVRDGTCSSTKPMPPTSASSTCRTSSCCQKRAARC